MGKFMFSSWPRKLYFTLYFGVKISIDTYVRVKFMTNSMSVTANLKVSESFSTGG